MSWAIKSALQARLSRETGAVVKDRGGKTSVALVYPNTYAVGMGNLAVHALYKMLNDRADVVCERAFLPEKNVVAEHKRTDTPILTMETQRPLCDFDAVAFTISFENDYLNILPILELSRIPHLAAQRGDGMPVLIAGGAAPSLNPRPIAAIFDAIVLGEAEAFADDLIPILAEKNLRSEKTELLVKMRGVFMGLPHPLPNPLPISAFGAIPPEAVTRERELVRRHAKDLDAWPVQTVIHTKEAEFGNMHLIEVQRGCPLNCRFCATAVVYSPPRTRSAGAILEMVDNGLKYGKRFGLIGAYIMMHPEFESIAEGIHSRGATFSPSSVHVREINDARAKLLATSGHKSVALGLEAGSERLRISTGKKISDDQCADAAKILAGNGITKLRLYFMIGLPDETEDDILAIAKLSTRIHGSVLSATHPKAGRNAQTTLTLSPFVPKMGTPFENAKFIGVEEIKKRTRAIEKLLKREKGITINADSPLNAAIEALFSRGSENAIDFIEDCHAKGNVKTALKDFSY